MQSQIIQKIMNNVEKNPDHYALWVDNYFYTYQELFFKANYLANLFANISNKNLCCAIFSEKTILTYQSILASILSGKIYTVLSTDALLHRNFQIIDEAKPEIICIDSTHDEMIISFLKNIPPTNVVVFRSDLYEILNNQVDQHHYFYADPNNSLSDKTDFNIHEDTHAYLMFTSGTTGKPKGVSIKHRNLSAYVNSICDLFIPEKNDRFLQFSELTFDISVHEIFVSWVVGATLYIFPSNAILGFKKFIQTHQLTFWMGAPANVHLFEQLNQLEPDCFPSLKSSFFCGEAFTQRQAKKWKRAAPHSRIINLYGPTEATVALTYFECNKQDTFDVVPIGLPFPYQSCALINTDNQLSQAGETGELILTGTQIVDGYWNNKQQTDQRFKYFSWDIENRIWYCTGDLAKFDPVYGYLYLGRLDDQWKIRGYRVEKLEIENELRRAAHTDRVAVVPYINPEGHIEGVIAFICGEIHEDLLKNLRQRLPDVMIPKKIISLKTLPLNKNGKVDYVVLKNLIVGEEI